MNMQPPTSPTPGSRDDFRTVEYEVEVKVTIHEQGEDPTTFTQSRGGWIDPRKSLDVLLHNTTVPLVQEAADALDPIVQRRAYGNRPVIA